MRQFRLYFPGEALVGQILLEQGRNLLAFAAHRFLRLFQLDNELIVVAHPLRVHALKAICTQNWPHFLQRD